MVDDGALVVPEEEKAKTRLEEAALRWRDDAQRMVVTSLEGNDAAEAIQKAIETTQKDWRALWARPIKKAYEAWKETKAAQDRIDTVLEDAKRAVKAARAAFIVRQQAARDQAAKELAQKQAEAEQLLLAAHATATESAVADAEDVRLREIEAALAAGDVEKAARLETLPIVPALPEPPRPPALVEALPVVPMQNVRTVWKFEIVDEDAVPRLYCSPDRTKIGPVVKALEAKHGIPGVVAKPDLDPRTARGPAKSMDSSFLK